MAVLFSHGRPRGVRAAPPLGLASARTAAHATARPDLHQEPHQVEPRGHPHEGQHRLAQVGADVEVLGARELVLEDDKHDGGDHRRRGREQQRGKGQDGDGQLAEEDPPRLVLPPRPLAEAQGGEKHAQEAEDGADQEAHKHPPAGQLDQVQDVDDLGGQGDARPGQEFVQDDVDRVEPVERLGRAAVGDALVVVALAEIPQSHLIEIVEADGLGDAVDEGGVRERRRDDVREADPEKVRRADDGLVVDVADLDEDEENRRQEVGEAGVDAEARWSGFLIVGKRIVFGFARG